MQVAKRLADVLELPRDRLAGQTGGLQVALEMGEIRLDELVDPARPVDQLGVCLRGRERHPVRHEQPHNGPLLHQ